MDEQALNELLECSVCLERLDHTSKVLPCQHTFCRRCLEEIVSTKHELRCPECRALVEVRVEDLPPNILLMRLLEGLKSSSFIKSINRPGSASPLSSSPNGSPHHSSKQATQACARVLYNYEAKESGDLALKKGDIVSLRKQIDENWYQGELDGQHGFFPAPYVQVIVPLQTTLPLCKALYEFDLDERDTDCLSFKKDEKITIIRRVDENWVEGKKGDKIGIFPTAFVEMNEAAKSLINGKPLPKVPTEDGTGDSVSDILFGTNASSLLSAISPQQKRHSFTSSPVTNSITAAQQQMNRRSLELSSLTLASSETTSPVVPAQPQLPSTSASQATSTSSTSVVTDSSASGSVSASASSDKLLPIPPGVTAAVYLAMYNYKPQKGDEIELKKGEYYTVMEKCQDGWYKGQCIISGQIGVFPGNYVQLVRTGSAFRPVASNVLNIRAKATNTTAASSTTNSVTSSTSSSISLRPPPPIPTSSHDSGLSVSNTGHSHHSAHTPGHSGHSGHSSSKHSSGHSSKVAGSSGHSSKASSHCVRTSAHGTPSVATASHSSHCAKHSNSHGHIMDSKPTMGASALILSKRTGHSATTTPSIPTSVWNSNLNAIQHSLSASTNVTPPNVVVGATGEKPVPLPGQKDKEKKEKKDKEKISLVKRLTSGGKSKKSSKTTYEYDGPAAVMETDASVSHSRSVSFPSDANVSSTDSSQHKKAASFDSSPSSGSKPTRPKPVLREKFRCIAPYPPQSDMELELKVGDVVYVHKKRDDGWFKGVLSRSGKAGLFPGSFVEKVE